MAISLSLIRWAITWPRTVLPRLQLSILSLQKLSRRSKERISKIMSIKGTRTVDEIHRDLGHVMWDKCGMSRSADGLILKRAAASKP